MIAACLAAVFLSAACGAREAASGDSPAAAGEQPFAAAAAESAAFVSRVEAAAAASGLPAELTLKLAAAARDERSTFEAELTAAMAGDPFLRLLVDKSHPLPEGYAPADLADLDSLSGKSFSVSRPGHRLRTSAAASLERMAAAARADGVALVVSSCYRSAEYQKTVYERIVRELGQEAADRESAPPGRSQHQLGLAVDFGSISDDFADTPASRWLEANGSRFGWSLSFPRATSP
jgi:D-alanyl-D-alanine carboxypeptidase